MDISSTTATNAALLVQRLVIQKPLALFGMRFLFDRILSKNRFALFGMRCLFHRILSKNRFALFGMRCLFHRILSKNRFTLFGMRCLFQRLIGASLSKRNRKSMRMRTVYSLANKTVLDTRKFPADITMMSDQF
ncbi:hypothetical protein [Brucella intermedia]|uniref:hypothetical protein n=1 Tax=Brucella intermedia TaxID=94625 RepID=UPI001FCE526A|nr:hypothetical protein [Brucella intermedia]